MKPKVPTVCILKSTDTTYCDRDIDECHEYVFHDAAHAIKHYTDSTTMKACPECVHWAQSKLFNTNNLTPLATRGLRNDR